MHDHQALIDQLSRSAMPVRRPWPASIRALLVATISLASGLVLTNGLRNPWHSLLDDNGWGLIQIILTLSTGVVVLVAAFELSIPGKRSRLQWVGAAVAPCWLFACLGVILLSHVPFGTLDDGVYCFRFLVVASLPMMGAVVIALRRTRSPQPTRTLLCAGGGVSALAASLLALCHPSSLKLVDFSMHLAAIACVIGSTILIGWPHVAYGRAERRLFEPELSEVERP